MAGRQDGVSGETCRSGEGGRIRAFVVPMAPGAVKGAGSKTAPREGRQGVGGAMSEARQARPGSADEATQGTKARRRERRWTEASIWTERMVSALVNGVKAWPRAGRRLDPWGGKWFSLIDKVYRPSTLAAAWTRVERNKGAAGVDGQGIERFAAQAERYLTELHEQLKDGSYRPAPVKRVEIPKGTARPARWASRRSRACPERKPGTGWCRRRSNWPLNQSLKRSSGRAATASVRDAAARRRCGRSIGF